MTRKPGRLKRRSRINPVSDKRRKRNAEAQPIRRDLVAEAGCCDICGHHENLCCHEFVQQSIRVECFDNPAVILVLCNSTPWRSGCHQFVHSYPKEWSFVRCLALLMVKRPECYDLAEACRLKGWKVEQSDVDFAISKLGDAA